MTQLYGVAHHSLVTVFDRIKPMAKRRQIKLAVVDTELPKAEILIFPTFKTFKKFAPSLNKQRKIAIILDTPLQLIEVKGLQILDYDRKPGLSYIFKHRPLEKIVLRNVVKQATGELRRLKLHIKEYDLIPRLLDTVQEGRFLDKFNNVLYRSTKMDVRNSIKLAVTSYLFGDTSLVKLKKTLHKQFRKGLGLDYANKVIEYFESEDGKKLREACQHIKVKKATGKKKQVPYKGVAKRFGVDHYELKYLSKLYRGSLKEAEYKPEILHRVVERNPTTKKPTIEAEI